jgi:uncharacterized protein (TIGR01777 family)
VRIVIAGGSGFLGSALANGWRADGHRVLVLTRHPRRADEIGWTPGSRDNSWIGALDGADAVVNLAGEGIADKRWSADRKAAILDSRIRATRAIVAGIEESRTPPRVLISGSAIGIYGSDRGDERLTEDSETGDDYLADVCRRWEAAAAPAAPLTRLVLLRTGVVLAKHGGALPQMALPFRLFAGGKVGSGRQYISWIHLADWLGLVRRALADSHVSGPLNLTAPSPVTNATFSDALGRALHRPAFMAAPAFALRLALGEMAGLLLGGQRVLPARAQGYGFEFRFPTVDAALRDIYGAA